MIAKLFAGGAMRFIEFSFNARLNLQFIYEKLFTVILLQLVIKNFNLYTILATVAKLIRKIAIIYFCEQKNLIQCPIHVSSTTKFSSRF